MPLEVGDRAPEFTLRDQNNQEWTLSECLGARGVLLVFCPFAFTGICADPFRRGERPGEARDPIVWKTAVAALSH